MHLYLSSSHIFIHFLEIPHHFFYFLECPTNLICFHFLEVSLQHPPVCPKFPQLSLSVKFELVQVSPSSKSPSSSSSSGSSSYSSSSSSGSSSSGSGSSRHTTYVYSKRLGHHAIWNYRKQTQHSCCDMDDYWRWW